MKEYRREVTASDLVIYIILTLMIIFALFAIGTATSMKPKYDDFMAAHQSAMIELNAMNREGTEVTK